MEPKGIKAKLEQYRSEGKRLFLTSSFQTQSLPLLHLIGRIDPTIPVFFLNTGFLFPESLMFRDEVAELLGLRVIELKSPISRIQQRDERGNFYFTSDPDRCCYFNKVLPLEPVLQEYDIWINGIRADQSKTRNGMSEEQPAPFGCIRFHPMLDWTSRMVHQYISLHGLPRHPLEEKGYVSIGCEPCTRKWCQQDGRDGRWFGMSKTECGLHTELVAK